jgi:hypothetical protein
MRAKDYKITTPILPPLVEENYDDDDQDELQ